MAPARSRSVPAWIAAGAATLAVTGCAGLLDLDVHYVDAGDTPSGGDASIADAGGASLDGTTQGARDAGDATAPSGPDAAANDAAANDAAAPDATPTPTAITFVQGVAAQATPGSTTGSVTFTSKVAAHDAIVVAVDFDLMATLQVSDTLGSTFSAAILPTGDFYPCAIYYALDVPSGGTDTLTLTLSAAPPTFFEIYAQEYAGIAGLDVTAGQSGTSVMMQSGTATTTVANDLIFGFAATGTAGAGVGFTTRSNFNQNLVEDAIAGNPGPYQATGTMVAGSGWTVLMAAFRPK
jgi:hypothetical protein